MNRKRITRRTAERLIRIAYDLEYLAGVLRDEGHERQSGSVRAASRECGNAGRSLMDKFGDR